jgi:hypothetical protein
MANEQQVDTGATEKKAAPEQANGAANVSVELIPANGTDQPILANMTSIHPAPGVALIDFGFLDPRTLKSFSELASTGKKLPRRLNGRLAARVALSYEGLAQLHAQIGRVLGVLQAAASKKTVN